MERDVWFMVAWIVGRHGADAPRIAEEMLERTRREHSVRLSGIEEADVEVCLRSAMQRSSGSARREIIVKSCIECSAAAWRRGITPTAPQTRRVHISAV